MIAVEQIQTELSQSKQDVIDQIWLDEEMLAIANQEAAELAAYIAPDFVSFAADGSTTAKSDYVQQISKGPKVKLKRLWGHFGSENSCCLAYMREREDGIVDICMSLWIECNGSWKKTFHHENVKFG